MCLSESLIGSAEFVVQAMAWQRTDDKSLSQPVMTHFTNAFMRNRPLAVNGPDVYVLQSHLQLGLKLTETSDSVSCSSSAIILYWLHIL